MRIPAACHAASATRGAMPRVHTFARRRRTPANLPAASSTAAPEIASWDVIATAAGKDVIDGFSIRPGSVPASVPSPTLPTEPDSATTKDVLLYRDTHGWCPFCERVWLALEEKGVEYDSVLINLRDKPQWYLDMIPTALVPAARIGGELVYESRDILMRLEQQFPDTSPLLPPEGSAEREEAIKMMDLADDFSKAGYAYLSGRDPDAPRTGGGNGTFPQAAPAGAEKMRELRDAFAAKAGELDALLEKRGGPYFLGESLSLVDVMFVPVLERLGANLPVFRSFELRDSDELPALRRWYAAMASRPAYKRVRSDDGTLNLIFRRLFGLGSAPPAEADGSDAGSEAAMPAGVGEEEWAARREAAAKIAANRAAVVADILKNSGLVHPTATGYGCTDAMSLAGVGPTPTRATTAAVDHVLRRLCGQLLTGHPGPRHPDREAAAIGAAALAFFRNRCSAPRDMSAAAAEQLRAACVEVLLDMY